MVKTLEIFNGIRRGLFENKGRFSPYSQANNR